MEITVNTVLLLLNLIRLFAREVSEFMLFHHLAVFNYNGAVCHLGNVLIVGNYYQRLAIFFCACFKQSNDLVAGFGI